MNTQIATFDFNHNQIRAIVVDGDPWFVAADVASALDYPSAPQMTRNLDDDEKGMHNVHTLGGSQEMLIINESGLYSAILKSRKPEAKQFKKWVTSEVLPSIRKNGGYIAGQDSDNPELIIAKALQVAQNVIERKSQELAHANAKVEALEPKANALDTIANAEGTVTLDQAAKLLGLQPKKFLNPWLIDNKWCFRRSGEINPHQDKVDKKYLIAVYRTYQGKSGEQHTTVQTRVTSLGMTQLTIELKKWYDKKGKAA